MNDTFEAFAKTVSRKVIALSVQHKALLENWSGTEFRPYDLAPTECAGFTNKQTAMDGPNFTIDVLVLKDESTAQLRTWCIHSTVGEDGVERFNTIQLTYAPDFAAAAVVTARAGEITRDDITALLVAADTHLLRVSISHESGVDQASRQTTGEHFDSTADNFSDPAVLEKAKSALAATLSSLEALPIQ